MFKRGLADLVAYQCKFGAILILPALGFDPRCKRIGLPTIRLEDQGHYYAQIKNALKAVLLGRFFIYMVGPTGLEPVTCRL